MYTCTRNIHVHVHSVQWNPFTADTIGTQVTSCPDFRVVLNPGYSFVKNCHNWDKSKCPYFEVCPYVRGVCIEGFHCTVYTITNPTGYTNLKDIQSSLAISPSAAEYSSYSDQVCSYCTRSSSSSCTTGKSGLDNWKCSACSLERNKHNGHIKNKHCAVHYSKSRNSR